MWQGTLLAAFIALSSACRSAPLLVESCILIPELGEAMCFDERRSPSDYDKEILEMSYYWCTNPEDAASLIDRASREKVSTRTIGWHGSFFKNFLD